MFVRVVDSDYPFFGLMAFHVFGDGKWAGPKTSQVPSDF